MVAGPVRVEGSVELWDGWSLALPTACLSERNRDGSWSAWDSARTIDVTIVTVGGASDGRPISAAVMLGQQPNAEGRGWIGSVEQIVEPGESGTTYRLAITAAAENSFMSCWVAHRSPDDRGWADQVLHGITFTPPQFRRGLLRRR